MSIKEKCAANLQTHRSISKYGDLLETNVLKTQNNIFNLSSNATQTAYFYRSVADIFVFSFSERVRTPPCQERPQKARRDGAVNLAQGVAAVAVKPQILLRRSFKC